MKKFTIRASAFVLVLTILLSLTAIVVPAAATQPAKYSTEYNSGQRGVICTTFDGTSALAYYGSTYSYDTLSDMSGNTLKLELRELMTDTHKVKTDYDDCHYEADRTDCQNGDGSVSFIYTKYNGKMSDWAGSTSNGWNREHVWPQSLGGFKTSGGGSDLHHIRPSDAKVNSTRGNKLYGNAPGGSAAKGSSVVGSLTGGTYGTYFEPHDDVKGDVARICLYVMVRWGGTYSQSDNITNVFQSVDVLLEWCEMDPVDTWEMGRNEVVEDIQGNRNVFIDYPELAWLLFNREIPDDMTTPSGEAKNQDGAGNGGNTDGGNTDGGDDIGGGNEPTPCTHSNTEIIGFVAATCKAQGYTGNTYCNDCKKIVKEGSTTPKADHTPGEWVVTKEPTELEAGMRTKSCTVCDAMLKQEIIFFGVASAEDFLELADVALAAESVAERFTAIADALSVYNALTNEKKDTVADKYAALTELIESYNTAAEAVNAEHNSVVSVVICIYDVSDLTACAALPVKKEY